MNRIKTSNVGRVRGFKTACLMMGALLIAANPSCQNLPGSEVVEVSPATEAFEVSPGAPVVKITTLSAPATAQSSDRVTISLVPEDIQLSNALAQKVIQVAGTLEVDILVSPVGADACTEGTIAAAFDVAVEDGVPISVNPPVVQAPDAAAAVLAHGDAALCTSLSANFSASVIIRRLNVAFETDAGNANGNTNMNNNGGDPGNTNDNMNANGDEDNDDNGNGDDNVNDNGDDDSDDSNGNDNLNDNSNSNDNMNDNGDDDNGNDNMNDNGDDDTSNDNSNGNDNSDDSNGNDNLNDNSNSNANMNDNGDDDNGNDNTNDNGDDDNTNDNGNANSG